MLIFFFLFRQVTQSVSIVPGLARWEDNEEGKIGHLIASQPDKKSYKRHRVGKLVGQVPCYGIGENLEVNLFSVSISAWILQLIMPAGVLAHPSTKTV